MTRRTVTRPRHRSLWPVAGTAAAVVLLFVAVVLVAPWTALAPAATPEPAPTTAPTNPAPISTATPTLPAPEVPSVVPARPDAGPAESGPAVTAVEMAARPAAISIARIGARSDLIDLDLDEDRRLEVPEDAAVAGWYVRSPRPGDVGPAIIAGHVDSHAGPGVFWRLHELQAGDEVQVERVDGTTATFQVDRVERWAKDEFPTEAVYRHADGAELRLITCGGTFDRAARSYRDNVIVFARLTS